jgi:L,D-transpeptidase catalytic domain
LFGDLPSDVLQTVGRRRLALRGWSAGLARSVGRQNAADLSTTVPDAEHAYDLPNVPFTDYFKDDGSAIHGTYWHDAFGTTQSQGCINVTWTDSEYLFDQTNPQIPGDQIGFAIDPAQATPLVIIN